LNIKKEVSRAKEPPFFLPTRYVNPLNLLEFSGVRVLHK